MRCWIVHWPGGPASTALPRLESPKAKRLQNRSLEAFDRRKQGLVAAASTAATAAAGTAATGTATAVRAAETTVRAATATTVAT